MGLCKSKNAVDMTDINQDVTQSESQETILTNQCINQSESIDTTLASQGFDYYYTGELKPALQCFHGALELREQEAPDSLAVAEAYIGIGLVLKEQGDLVGALTYYHQALQIWERDEPSSLTVAMCYNNVGTVL